MPDLDDVLCHGAAHALVAEGRHVAVLSITVMAGSSTDDWAGQVEAPGIGGMDRAVVALAGPAFDELRAGIEVDDWDADALKALRALDGDGARFDEAARIAASEVARIRHRIEDLAGILRVHVDERGTDFLGRSTLDGEELRRILASAR